MLVGWAPACSTRRRPASCASTEVPPTASTTGKTSNPSRIASGDGNVRHASVHRAAITSFPAAGHLGGFAKFDVFPRIDRGAIVDEDVAKHVEQRRHRGLVHTRLHVDRRENDRQPAGHRGLRHGDDVLQERSVIHRPDGVHLRRLIVDDEQGRVLRREQMVRHRITDRFTTHDAPLQLGLPRTPRLRRMRTMRCTTPTRRRTSNRMRPPPQNNAASKRLKANERDPRHTVDRPGARPPASAFGWQARFPIPLAGWPATMTGAAADRSGGPMRKPQAYAVNIDSFVIE